MRNAFIETLALTKSEIPPWLITGDLGWNAIEPFQDAHPERFVNAGVAEQAMTSIAAGIASATGAAIFAYSIANFSTFRCLEQIRNDVVYHRNSVIIVALGAGFSYGTLGYTHFGIEDIAVIRALGDMPIYCPCDGIETKAITQYLIHNPQPAYLRLGRHAPLPIRDIEEPRPGHLRHVAEGSDVAIIVTGAIVHEAIEARATLHARGISARILSCHSVRPIDIESLRRLSSERIPIVTVEEHRASGGLGTEVMEACAQHGIDVEIKALGVTQLQLSKAGSRSYLLEKHGLNGTSIATHIEKWLTDGS
jgi:transketolase